MTLAIALSAFLSLVAASTVLQVGKPREPITAGQAAFTVVVNMAIIVWLIWAAA